MRHAKVIDETVHDADVVLALDGCGRLEEMHMQVIDADAKRERRGEAVFGAPTDRPGGIVDVGSAESTDSAWNGPSNLCAAHEQMKIRAHQVAAGGAKHGTS